MPFAPDQEPPLPALPPKLGDALLQVLFDDAARRDQAFAALVAAHPEHAPALAAHRRRHERMEHDAPADDLAAAVGNIAGYRLLGLLGEGGMGTVYRAEQLVPVHRQVALKVIKPGMDSKAVLARFEQERQALAAMDHDAIARVFDCGSSARGQPYFAMELVEGQPITRFCDERRSSLQERIELFQQVCAGVQHAHQKGVIHRDLKPGNVLVTEQGERRVVKIIDFGVARATDRNLAIGSLFTEQGAVVGTPEYMSPEQASGDTRRVDTRTDVYSLGVILYELLVGALPFPMADLRAAGLAEIQRRLSEDEPPKPSTRLTTLGELAQECAARRQVSTEALRRELAADLDWVVLKAMAKEAERRYESATALAADLQHYLAHEPLVAGPPTRWYRLRKLLRRHRPMVAAGGAVFVTAVVGAVVAVQFALAEQAKVREFDLLAGLVLHDQAVARANSLFPSWPHQIERMESWLRDDCGRLLAMRPEIERTVANLRERALPATPEDLALDRRAHPKHRLWVQQGYRLHTLRLAQRIRSGAESLVVPPLTPEQMALGADELSELAWERVAGTPKAGQQDGRTVGAEEAMGLALARAAVALAHGPQEACKALHSLAHAELANGQDEAAKQRIAEALALPVDDAMKTDCRRAQAEIMLATADPAATLATAEAAYTALTTEVSERRSLQFAAPAPRFLHDALNDLLVKLRGLETVWQRRVQQRLVWARQIGELSRNHPKAEFRWDEARAGVATNPNYAGRGIQLRDEDVFGLVPLGENPVTGLWEFYDLRSAWDGASDPRDIYVPAIEPDGSIQVTEATGIVFVLLPGGPTQLGVQDADPNGPNYDPAPHLATDWDHKVQSVTLDPFFMARHEITQAQWTRLSIWEDNKPQPSQYLPGELAAGIPITPTNPVETVNWETCNLVLSRSALTLPTEAQWEYACRAGGSSPWSCPLEELRNHANLHDQTIQSYGMQLPLASEPWHDGHSAHAPVGSFKPNAFGLFDMHGNVREWCLDLWSSSAPLRPGDGLRARHDGSGNRPWRGGSFIYLAKMAKSAERNFGDAARANLDLGVRAARLLRPNAPRLLPR